MISTPAPTAKIASSVRRTILNLATGALWYVPNRFAVVRVCGSYSLRCVLFHNICDTESPFTKGLGGTISRKRFEAALRFFTRHYTPVGLQDVLSSFDGQPLPTRPILITFDDAYASVSEVAVPLCMNFRVPAMFFVNAECLDNHRLGLDNLICYVANALGVDAINDVILAVSRCEDLRIGSLREVFSRFLPSISLATRGAFRDALIRLTGASEGELAAAANLYLSSHELRTLAASGVEVGNHTYTHVHCRSLSRGDFGKEIDRNRARLEEVSGTPVRSFSVPYGSSADLTCDLQLHLHRSGYAAIFLSESCANSPWADRYRLNRVTVTSGTDASLFSEVEILPRVRTWRRRLIGAQLHRSTTGRRDVLAEVSVSRLPR